MALFPRRGLPPRTASDAAPAGQVVETVVKQLEPWKIALGILVGSCAAAVGAHAYMQRFATKSDMAEQMKAHGSGWHEPSRLKYEDLSNRTAKLEAQFAIIYDSLRSIGAAVGAPIPEPK